MTSSDAINSSEISEPILSQKSVGVMRTPCSHYFHRECLVNWVDVKMECPTCRAPLPPLWSFYILSLFKLRFPAQDPPSALPKTKRNCEVLLNGWALCGVGLRCGQKVAERGFDPPTFELWAQRDTTTPPCWLVKNAFNLVMMQRQSKIPFSRSKGGYLTINFMGEF